MYVQHHWNVCRFSWCSQDPRVDPKYDSPFTRPAAANYSNRSGTASFGKLMRSAVKLVYICIVGTVFFWVDFVTHSHVIQHDNLVWQGRLQVSLFPEVLWSFRLHLQILSVGIMRKYLGRLHSRKDKKSWNGSEWLELSAPDGLWSTIYPLPKCGSPWH